MKKEVMNSRDRVIWVIRHQEPDQIHIDISNDKEGMDGLIDYYGISTSHDFESKTFIGADGTLFEKKKINARFFRGKIHIVFLQGLGFLKWSGIKSISLWIS